MIQKVLKVGSSAAVTIPKKALSELGVSIGDSIKVDISKKQMTIVPVRNNKNDQHERIAKLTLDFVDKYRDDLEALADK